MLSPAVKQFVCCKDNVGAAPCQVFFQKLVANDQNVMVNDKFALFFRLILLNLFVC